MSSSNEHDHEDSNDSKTFIDKLLVEMKSEFNKNSKTENSDENDDDDDLLNKPSTLKVETTDTNFLIDTESPSNITKIETIEDTTKQEKLSSNTSDLESPDDNNETKPRIVLTLRPEKTKAIVLNNYGTDKDNSSEEASPAGRRSLRIKINTPEEKEKKIEMESGLKRSARRRSKDCTESILQSAIARKEKSYNETVRPQRLTRKLKPTAKILANLEMCQKNVSLKNDKNKQNDNKNNKTNNKSPTLERQRFFYDKLEKCTDKAILDAYIKQEDQPLTDYKKIKRKIKVKNVKSLMKKPKKIEENESDSSSFSSPQETEPEKEKDDDKNTKNLRKCVDGKSRRSHRKTSRTQDSDDRVEDSDPPEPISANAADEISPAEPQSSVLTETKPIVLNRCLCQISSQIFLNVPNNNSETVTYCTALDMINERIIGCNNVVGNGVMMLRPSTRIPYIILCDVHKERLIRHNCCPTCGLFCTQGRFTECDAKHQYHRECSINICPHCGIKTPEHDIEIVMKCKKDPVFLPIQKSHYPSAKMSFPKNPHNNERSITPPLISSQILEKIKLISNRNNYNDLNLEFNITSLSNAIKQNDVEKVATLLENKEKNVTEIIPNSDGLSVLHLASQLGNLAIVHVLLLTGMEQDIFDKEQNTPLMLAILAFQNDVAKYLIKCGADISLKGTDGMSALHLAAKCGNLTACEHLLSSAENRRTFINCVDDGGWTPLVWACEHGHVDVARFLLLNGSDPQLRDVEHNVALHWASFSGNTKIMEMLFNAGCEVNAINAHGDSPLHIATREDKYNCVIMLLARGADVYLVNTSNETPLDCCVPEPSDCRIAIELNINLQKIVTTSANRKNTILTNDISRGKELNPIQCINTIDDDKKKPTDFLYIIENCIASDDIIIDRKITTLHSCVCEDRCTTIDCLCGNNSLKCWYNEEGKLSSDFNYADPPMIFECNATCTCNAITCYNRVVQHGLTQRFQLFRTENKGWGICTLRFIPRGAYVCEYVGEILSDLDADQREDDSYLFDLDNRDGESYCIDAKRYGNLSRFINHSCNPNLLPVRIFIDHQDLRFPRIAFFAKRDIQVNEELGFDYGEKFWIIKYKSFTCTCEYDLCKYSETTIQTTLDNYQRRLLAEYDV